MAKLVITKEAKADISAILRSVGEYTASSATVAKLRNDFLEKFANIAYLPKSYRLYDDGTRHAFCRRYRIVYKEINDEVHILTVLHSLRKYP